MHICTIEIPQTSWYHINTRISNTKSKPENIHYPLQPHQKSPPLQSWIKKTWGLTLWHAYTCKSRPYDRPSMPRPRSRLTEKLTSMDFFQQKKQPSKIQALELNGIDIMLTYSKIVKNLDPLQQRIFLNTFLPASDSRPSEPFRALISKHLATYNCENMFPGMWCPENPIPKKKNCLSHWWLHNFTISFSETAPIPQASFCSSKKSKNNHKSISFRVLSGQFLGILCLFL